MLYKLSRGNAPRAGKNAASGTALRLTQWPLCFIHAWKLHYYKDLTLKRVYLFLFNLIE